MSMKNQENTGVRAVIKSFFSKALNPVNSVDRLQRGLGGAIVDRTETVERRSCFGNSQQIIIRLGVLFSSS